MAWIRVDEELARDPRLGRLAVFLKCHPLMALGYVISFRSWASQHLENGSIKDVSMTTIALGSQWTGDEGAFFEGLMESDFITESAVVEWKTFAGSIKTYRERSAKRMKQYRARNVVRNVTPAVTGRLRSDLDLDLDLDNTPSANAQGPQLAPPTHLLPGESAIPKSPDRAPVLAKPAKLPRAKVRVLYSERFQDFWAHYPNRIGKGAAWKSWQRAAASFDGGEAELYEVVREPLMDARASEQWTKDHGQFIPMPATWLNQRRWEDEL